MSEHVRDLLEGRALPDHVSGEGVLPIPHAE